MARAIGVIATVYRYYKIYSRESGFTTMLDTMSVDLLWSQQQFGQSGQLAARWGFIDTPLASGHLRTYLFARSEDYTLFVLSCG